MQHRQGGPPAPAAGNKSWARARRQASQSKAVVGLHQGPTLAPTCFFAFKLLPSGQWQLGMNADASGAVASHAHERRRRGGPMRAASVAAVAEDGCRSLVHHIPVPVRMPGNPFRSKDTEGGLLGGQGLRSDDQWDDHDLNQPLDAAGASSAAGAAASGAAGGAATAAAVTPAAPEAAQRAAAPPAVTAAEAPLPPPPPPIATATFIPPPLATQPPPTIGVPASTAGAWGAAQPAQQPGVWGVSSSQFDSSGPAGYPPSAAPYGAYEAGAPGFQPQPWTGGYSDQPLTCE